jgi:hypothetical protein
MNKHHRLLRYTVIDEYRPRKDALIFLFFMALIVTSLFALVAWQDRQLIEDTFSVPEAQAEAFSEPSDPCGLTDVVCANEPKIIYAEVSKYTAQETCPTDCINAAGERPVAGVSIACPRQYHLGQLLTVENKSYRCDDRTHQQYDGRFDIFEGYSQEDYQRALEFGVQVLPVVIK